MRHNIGRDTSGTLAGRCDTSATRHSRTPLEQPRRAGTEKPTQRHSRNGTGPTQACVYTADTDTGRHSPTQPTQTSRHRPTQPTQPDTLLATHATCELVHIRHCGAPPTQSKRKQATNMTRDTVHVSVVPVSLCFWKASPGPARPLPKRRNCPRCGGMK